MNGHLEAFLTDLQAHSKYSDNTCQAYAVDLRRFVDYMSGKLGRDPKIEDLSRQSVTSYLESEKKTGYKPSTLYRRRSALRKFLDYLTQLGVTEVRASENKEFLKPRERRSVSEGRKIDYLSDAELKRLIETFSREDNPRARRDQAILVLMLETGISIGNLIELDMNDFNSRNGRLQVLTAEGHQVRLNIPQATPLIREYLLLGRPELTQSNAEDALFVSQMGGRISRQGVWQMLRNRGKQAKLKQQLSARTIRHTAARRMVKEGKPLEQIQVSLGHENLFSTRSLVRRLKKT